MFKVSPEVDHVDTDLFSSPFLFAVKFSNLCMLNIDEWAFIGARAVNGMNSVHFLCESFFNLLFTVQVTSAGIYTLSSPITETSMEYYDKMMNVNVR